MHNFGKVVGGFADFFCLYELCEFLFMGRGFVRPRWGRGGGGCVCPQVARQEARPRCDYYFVRPLWGLFF